MTRPTPSLTLLRLAALLLAFTAASPGVAADAAATSATSATAATPATPTDGTSSDGGASK